MRFLWHFPVGVIFAVIEQHERDSYGERDASADERRQVIPVRSVVGVEVPDGCDCRVLGHHDQVEEGEFPARRRALDVDHGEVVHPAHDEIVEELAARPLLSVLGGAKVGPLSIRHEQ